MPTLPSDVKVEENMGKVEMPSLDLPKPKESPLPGLIADEQARDLEKKLQDPSKMPGEDLSPEKLDERFANGIEVMALRPGYFKGERKSEGAKFFVKSFKELGSWMRCLDRVAERKHNEIMKKKHEELMKKRKQALGY